jgi:hypothetical protein
MSEWLFESVVEICLTSTQDNASIDRKIDLCPGSRLFLADALWVKLGRLVAALGGWRTSQTWEVGGQCRSSRLGSSVSAARCWRFAKFQHRPENWQHHRPSSLTGPLSRFSTVTLTQCLKIAVPGGQEDLGYGLHVDARPRGKTASRVGGFWLYCGT